MSRKTIIALRLIVAAGGVAAVGIQLAVLARTPKFDLFDFFSSFSVLSVLFASTVLVWVAARALKRKKASTMLDKLRGAAVVYLLSGAVLSALFVRRFSDELASPFFATELILQVALPIALCADWVVKSPRAEILSRTISQWLWFPLFYVCLVVGRGAIVSWYPYAFMNPDTDGYAAVLLHLIGAFFVIASVAWAVAEVGNRGRSRGEKAPAQPEVG